MAKVNKKPGTEVAVVKPDANLPAYLAGFKGPTGTENIDAGDINIPRVKIGQSTSEEVKAGDVGYGDLFLNIDGQILTKAGVPLPFVIVAQAKEYLLWRDRKNGGGIMARARPVSTPEGKRYAWDKPNQKFENKVGGKTAVTWQTKKYIEEDGLDQWGSEVPGNKDSGIAATAHHNYVVVFPTLGDMIAGLSLSRSAAKRAKDLNAMLKMGSGPLAARQYEVITVDDKSDEGPFKNVKFKPAGHVSEAQFIRYQQLADNFAGKVINVDQSDGGDEVVRDGRA